MTADANRKSVIDLSSDKPLVDPAEDAYGYAKFSSDIAKAIGETRNPEGLVIAISAPWGAGKTTALNFIKSYLGSVEEPVRPIVIDFNPWWFDGKEHLAKQFLASFSSTLIGESEALREVGRQLAVFSAAIGEVVSAVNPIPIVGKLIPYALVKLGGAESGVPQMKSKIAGALRSQSKRVVFIVDDIDRLTPSDILELVKVIKALADFPNVVYLLAYDSNYVSTAIGNVLGVSGREYLEKIVQAQFDLPRVDKVRLRKHLFDRINSIFSSGDIPADSQYFSNLYFEGLDLFVEHPRDIVRIANAISVTFPPVSADVNPVDFLAMEMIRIYLPGLYEVIRSGREHFVGFSPSDEYQKRGEKEFHERWAALVPEEIRARMIALVKRMFPRVEGVLGNMGYAGEFATIWRKARRVCSPEIFDFYFHGVSPDVLSRAELMEIVRSLADQEGFEHHLLRAEAVLRPTGKSKASDVLELLPDVLDGIDVESAIRGIWALLNIGDRLLLGSEESGGLFGVPRIWRLCWTVEHLLEKVPSQDRFGVVRESVLRGLAFELNSYLLGVIDKAHAEGKQDSVWSSVSPDELANLKLIVCNRLAEFQPEELVTIKDLPYVLRKWSEWGDPNQVSSRITAILSRADWALRFVAEFLQHTRSQVMGDYAIQRIPRINLDWVEGVCDLDELYAATSSIDVGSVSGDSRVALELFRKNYLLKKAGKPYGDADES